MQLLCLLRDLCDMQIFNCAVLRINSSCENLRSLMCLFSPFFLPPLPLCICNQQPTDPPFYRAPGCSPVVGISSRLDDLGCGPAFVQPTWEAAGAAPWRRFRRRRRCHDTAGSSTRVSAQDQRPISGRMKLQDVSSLQKED